MDNTNHISRIDVKASIIAAHQEYDQRRTLPAQLRFIFFPEQKPHIQQRMLNEIFTVRSYPLHLDDGTTTTQHLL